MNAYQPVGRPSTVSSGNRARARRVTDRPRTDRVDDRDGEEHGADQQQPALQVAARAERRDQSAAEAGREQADEPAAGVDEVPDVRPHRAAVAGLQGLVGRIGGPA